MADAAQHQVRHQQHRCARVASANNSRLTDTTDCKDALRVDPDREAPQAFVCKSTKFIVFYIRCIVFNQHLNQT